MCGIVGYLGSKKTLQVLLDGLRRLEYRGYDSAGISIGAQGKEIRNIKSVGKIAALAQAIGNQEIDGDFGIAHTRWATHGGVTEKNAHPHHDCKKNIFLAHNGIIENYRELRAKLLEEGHKFYSETDTEVLAHLIEKFFNGNLENAVISALKLVKGSYGLAVIAKDDPEKIVVAKNSSPILIGMGNDEYLVASDASAILDHTKEVVYLNDGEIAVITLQGVEFTNLANQKLDKKKEVLEWNISEAQKGGYPHFMIKEIFEQADSIKNSLAGRLMVKEGNAKLGGIENIAEKLRDIDRLIITGCGTAYLAGLVGEFMLEEYAGIPVEVEMASELRYRKPVLDKNTALLCISQSGETIDTLVALREAKMKGLPTMGIVNVVGSTIARETEAGIYNHIGPEVSVASTKAFTSQLTILSLLTLFLGRQRQMSLVTGQRIAKELNALPKLIQKVLEQEPEIKKLAKKYYKSNNFLFIGRKYNYPVALEGALKLKEISYMNAQGCAAGETKHGPIAMIDKDFPTFAIAPKDSVYEKMISNIEEIKARGGSILAIATQGDKEIAKITKDVIYIPKTLEMLTPILSVIPLQIFAYHCAAMRGYDVDKPRNLAKSVTVE